MALVAGAHVPGLPMPDLDGFVRSHRSVLDGLAATCPSATFEGLGRHLFVDAGFRGDTDDYYDARNSYLHEVLHRRLGIPITLSIVALVVGERLGIPVQGIGMPGHFLVGDAADPDHFLDPFEGGNMLSKAGAEGVFRALHGPDARFVDELLAPVSATAILGRMLANLKHIHGARRDQRALVRVLELRVLLPDVPPTERRDLATALASVGRFVDAAAELESLGETDAAGRLRARLN